MPRPGGGAAPAVSSARDAVAAAAAALAAAGCDTPRLDAELLIADAAGVDRSALVVEPELALSPAAARSAMEHVRRRVAREPVAYILGRRAFRRLRLMVDARVLIPRPETELLVEVAASLAPRGGWVHDAGTGCGAVALALADERPDLRVSASDVSADAVAVARANAARLGLDVEFCVGAGAPSAEPDVLSLVTANMPYVRQDEVALLAPEITRYEPGVALVGGPDGLEVIRGLLLEARRGTLVALEHAPDQAAEVRALLAGAQTHRDLAGHERVTVGRAR